MGWLTKIKAAARKNPDGVATGVDKATDFIDDRTGRKYSGHLDKVDEAVADQLGVSTRRRRGKSRRDR